jgi:hypothetical protein
MSLPPLNKYKLEMLLRTAAARSWICRLVIERAASGGGSKFPSSFRCHSVVTPLHSVDDYSIFALPCGE